MCEYVCCFVCYLYCISAHISLYLFGGLCECGVVAACLCFLLSPFAFEHFE